MIIHSAMSEDKLIPLQCKKFSCRSLTRVVASSEVHTTVSTTASIVLWLGQLAGEYIQLHRWRNPLNCGGARVCTDSACDNNGNTL